LGQGGVRDVDWVRHHIKESLLQKEC